MTNSRREILKIIAILALIIFCLFFIEPGLQESPYNQF